ncbi:CcdB family protein [Sphingomonadaceae bacterium LXI357]|uniref:Toxin CcdB n=2 Tax=Stakelama marina TaxID=2826939 RepID=A0A8T4IG78_9SPHN|nr:CcdB family protein [Stakelama marina]
MLVVDMQSDLIDHFDTRFVIPLVRPGDGNQVIDRLTPPFAMARQRRIPAPQDAGAVHKANLGPAVASLAHRDPEITAALDMLISGF